jgi:hypothetical protein
LPVKPKIISLTPAEAGQNTVKQREYNPDKACLRWQPGAFTPPVSVRRISKNRCRKLRAYDVSALSEARFHESAKSGEVLGARSIEPFEGGRWRLRWMRANGWSRSNGYGN